jgi:hypothetical protein
MAREYTYAPEEEECGCRRNGSSCQTPHQSLSAHTNICTKPRQHHGNAFPLMQWAVTHRCIHAQRERTCSRGSTHKNKQTHQLVTYRYTGASGDFPAKKRGEKQLSETKYAHMCMTACAHGSQSAHASYKDVHAHETFHMYLHARTHIHTYTVHTR